MFPSERGVSEPLFFDCITDLNVERKDGEKTEELLGKEVLSLLKDSLIVE